MARLGRYNMLRQGNIGTVPASKVKAGSSKEQYGTTLGDMEWNMEWERYLTSKKGDVWHTCNGCYLFPQKSICSCQHWGSLEPRRPTHSRVPAFFWRRPRTFRSQMDGVASRTGWPPSIYLISIRHPRTWPELDIFSCQAWCVAINARIWKKYHIICQTSPRIGEMLLIHG